MAGKQTSLIGLAEATPQFIDGKFEAGEGERFTVLNPSDGSAVAEIAGVSLDQTGRAIQAARRAFDSGVWSGKSAKERVEILHRYVAALREQQDELTDVTTKEAGCPIGKPDNMTGMISRLQVAGPLNHGDEFLDFFLTLPEEVSNPLPLKDRITPFGGTIQSVRRYTPIGVVSAIAAYNFPTYTAMWKVLPALVTGNTVVLRPSPLTPITALGFARAAEMAGLPAGVVNVVMEGGLDGAKLMTTHPMVDMVAFTGSSGVGKLVMKQAADSMKRIQMELGGKSAQIFMPDAVDQAGPAIWGVCGSHAGQGCVLGTRIFVPEEKKQEVMEAMKAAISNVVIGRADDAETTMGPVISEGQVERCEHFVKLAIEDGAKVFHGGKRPEHLDKGYFFEPTILDTPDNKNAAAQEEIFGPVVSVIGYRDLDHAVEMANDSPYGLSGYVFGNDRRKALELAMRIRSGSVNVNGILAGPYNSSGGQRLSGMGRERGEEGIRLYQEMTCINIGA